MLWVILVFLSKKFNSHKKHTHETSCSRFKKKKKNTFYLKFGSQLFSLKCVTSWHLVLIGKLTNYIHRASHKDKWQRMKAAKGAGSVMPLSVGETWAGIIRVAWVVALLVFSTGCICHMYHSAAQWIRCSPWIIKFSSNPDRTDKRFILVKPHWCCRGWVRVGVGVGFRRRCRERQREGWKRPIRPTISDENYQLAFTFHLNGSCLAGAGPSRSMRYEICNLCSWEFSFNARLFWNNHQRRECHVTNFSGKITPWQYSLTVIQSLTLH